MRDSRPQPPRFPPSPSVPPDSATLLLCGARLADGRTVDVRLGGGRIEAVGTPGILTIGAAGARVDLRDFLLLPAPAEPHAHCDTALSADGPGGMGHADGPGGRGGTGSTGPVSHHPEEVQRRATEA